MENNNNGELGVIRSYRFILQHPLKIDDVLDPTVEKNITKLQDEKTGERLFLIEKVEIK